MEKLWIEEESISLYGEGLIQDSHHGRSGDGSMVPCRQGLANQLYPGNMLPNQSSRCLMDIP